MSCRSAYRHMLFSHQPISAFLPFAHPEYIVMPARTYTSAQVRTFENETSALLPLTRIAAPLVPTVLGSIGMSQNTQRPPSMTGAIDGFLADIMHLEPALRPRLARAYAMHASPVIDQARLALSRALRTLVEPFQIKHPDLPSAAATFGAGLRALVWSRTAGPMGQHEIGLCQYRSLPVLVLLGMCGYAVLLLVCSLAERLDGLLSGGYPKGDRHRSFPPHGPISVLASTVAGAPATATRPAAVPLLGHAALLAYVRPSTSHWPRHYLEAFGHAHGSAPRPSPTTPIDQGSHVPIRLSRAAVLRDLAEGTVVLSVPDALQVGCARIDSGRADRAREERIEQWMDKWAGVEWS